MMSHYWAFDATSILLILSPGIDTVLVTRNTVTHSAKGGLFSAFGIASGILVHMFAAGLGLSVILMQSAKLFEVIKLLGAAYLIYLGISSFRNRTKHNRVQTGQLTNPQNYKYLRLYREGITGKAKTAVTSS